MWKTRDRLALHLAAIAGIVLGTGMALIPGQVATAQAPAGGDVLFSECDLLEPPDQAEQAYWRAECDMVAADASYQAGVWRPYVRRLDG